MERNLTENHIQLSKKEFQKMVFIMNALNDGWKVQKQEDDFIFTKKHEGKREIFKSDYLEKFIYSNSDIQKLTI
jgi:hypothetical protein